MNNRKVVQPFQIAKSAVFLNRWTLGNTQNATVKSITLWCACKVVQAQTGCSQCLQCVPPLAIQLGP